jgi:hypothetical protein
MATGIIKSWHSQRSFGFIKADDDTGDVFVHISGCAAARCALAMLSSTKPNHRAGTQVSSKPLTCACWTDAAARQWHAADAGAAGGCGNAATISSGPEPRLIPQLNRDGKKPRAARRPALSSACRSRVRRHGGCGRPMASGTAKPNRQGLGQQCPAVNCADERQRCAGPAAGANQSR